MKVVRIIGIIVLITLLVLIRMFEADLFYDPLQLFFRTEHSNKLLPDFDLLSLLGNVAYRFFLNTFISLAILWLVFKNISAIKLAAILYIAMFLVLFLLYSFLVNSSEAGNHLFLFYVRRFLIQPIFLLILLPAFYFQLKNN